MLLSLSPGGQVDPEALDFFRMANMLRVTKDVWDEQADIDACFLAWRKWQGRRCWMDCLDMIPGQVRLMSPPVRISKTVFDKGDIALAGKGYIKLCQLTKPQMGPIVDAGVGNSRYDGRRLPSLDDFALKLITDQEMLACNQNGVMGSLVVDGGWKLGASLKRELWIGVG